MLDRFIRHNQFQKGLTTFEATDPHLLSLSRLKYQFSSNWWHQLSLDTPGIYILTGGRQVGKSTSCKLLIKECLQKNQFDPLNILYLPCDEIFDAKELSQVMRYFLEETSGSFLLVVDEITFVPQWDRVVKALADEGWFTKGLCILTGSDSLILKEAAMSFPGRRGTASKTDFHLYPLTFNQYVELIQRKNENITNEQLAIYFQDYLQSGGYLRAINDFAEHGKVTEATFQTYEQWIRGDFLKQGKNEQYLLAVLNALFIIGVSQVSYSTLTQNIGLMSKETCLEYCRLLERMDVLFNLQAYDQNRKQGFPKKARKFHFVDPFIYRTIFNWLSREGYVNQGIDESMMVEACVASHCHRFARTYYFKGQGEIDVIWLKDKVMRALEVKWANQVRSTDLKMLKHFKDSIILTKTTHEGEIGEIKAMPVYRFLYGLMFDRAENL